MDTRAALSHLGFDDTTYDAAGELLLTLAGRARAFCATEIPDLIESIASKSGDLAPSLQRLNPAERTQRLQSALMLLFAHSLLQVADGFVHFVIDRDLMHNMRSHAQEPRPGSWQILIPAGTVYITTGKERSGQRKRAGEVQPDRINDWQIVRTRPGEAVIWAPPEIVYTGAGAAWYHAMCTGPLAIQVNQRMAHRLSWYKRLELSKDRFQKPISQVLAEHAARQPN